MMKLNCLLKSSQFSSALQLSNRLGATGQTLDLRIKVLMANAQFQPALGLIEEQLRAQPYDQYYIALWASCLKQVDTVKYQQLCDMDKIVFELDIEPVDGFNSIKAFNLALQTVLKRLHVTNHNPLNQSVNIGTQTPGFLFNHQDPIIQALATTLKRAIEKAFANCDFDKLPNWHPLYQLKKQHINFATAWSVWLTSGGHHNSHIHPKGWYSGVYYVSTPEFEAQQHEGFLGLGRAGLKLDLDDSFDKLVHSKAGKLVLFPSFLWHETLPFESTQPRVSVAFDLV